MKQGQSSYLPTLDGWRTVAVLLVVGYHGSPAAIHWLSFFNYGHHGVNIFFGISGFLICSRLLNEEERCGKISLRNFYIRRAFRILPAAFIYIGFINLMAAFSVMTPPTAIESLASCFFFRNLLPPGHSTSYTGHYWSLAVEEHFYLVWPAFLLLAGSKRALRLTPLLAIGFEVWRYVDTEFGLTNLDGLLFYQRTDRCLDCLLWGCALALLVRRPGWRERLTRITAMPWWFAYLGALIFVWVYPLPSSLVLESMLIPLVVLGTVLHPLTPVGRFLEWQPMAWFGRLSYGVYLWQSALFVGRYQAPVDLQVWPVNAVALVAVAAISYYAIEKPLIAAGRRMTIGLAAGPLPRKVTAERPAGASDPQLSPQESA